MQQTTLFRLDLGGVLVNVHSLPTQTYDLLVEGHLQQADVHMFHDRCTAHSKILHAACRQSSAGDELEAVSCLTFTYRSAGDAELGNELDLSASHVCATYIHSQVMLGVDYLTQGVLGAMLRAVQRIAVDAIENSATRICATFTDLAVDIPVSMSTEAVGVGLRVGLLECTHRTLLDSSMTGSVHCSNVLAIDGNGVCLMANAVPSDIQVSYGLTSSEPSFLTTAVEIPEVVLALTHSHVQTLLDTIALNLTRGDDLRVAADSSRDGTQGGLDHFDAFTADEWAYIRDPGGYLFSVQLTRVALHALPGWWCYGVVKAGWRSFLCCPRPHRSPPPQLTPGTTCALLMWSCVCSSLRGSPIPCIRSGRSNEAAI